MIYWNFDNDVDESIKDLRIHYYDDFLVYQNPLKVVISTTFSEHA